MQIPFNPSALTGKKSRPETKLQQIYQGLPSEQQQQLMDYAEFLAERHPVESAPVDLQIVDIPRPQQESVVAAIKRLSASYHMVDRSKMLHETSGLVTQHVMQGRDAAAVIDDLELLFKNIYEKQFGKTD
jgi:hypothetical protein